MQRRSADFGLAYADDARTLCDALRVPKHAFQKILITYRNDRMSHEKIRRITRIE